MVLKSNRAVLAELKPGVSWRDMHLLAEEVLLTGLKELGLVTGSVEEMQEKRIAAVFMPHGLGHLIGLDVHDCGGRLVSGRKKSAEGAPEPGLETLRTARVM